MNLYEKFIQAIKPTWESTEPFPSYKDRDENSFRVLHLSQSEFEYLKHYLRVNLSLIDEVLRDKTVSKKDLRYLKKERKALSEIQRKLKNESRL